jgi:alkylhydroperoxidase/carboxymuconolactone decarboxylase family protein YurZ
VTKASLLSLALLIAGASSAEAQTPVRPSGPVQQKIAPGLANYTDEVLFGQVWPSPELSPRDRSLVVISALIATNRPAQLQGHLGRALDNGVTPVEASGVLTHLAFYAGWPNAVSALEVYDKVYTARNVDLAALQGDVGRARFCSRSGQPTRRPILGDRAEVHAVDLRGRGRRPLAAGRSFQA